jgi:hypothetical protein
MKKNIICIVSLFFALISQAPLYAQSVTKIVEVLAGYTTVTGSNSYTDSAVITLSGNYDYKYGTASGLWGTQMQKISSFKISTGECYKRIPTAHQVKIRRVDNAFVTGNTSVLWMEADTTRGKVNVRTIYQDSMEVAFASGYFNWGTDNLFDNTVPGTNNNNIERFDLIFPSGYVITNAVTEGFAIFERGVAGAHDPVKISGITGLNGQGDPNGYKALPLTIATGDWGDIPGTTIKHVVLRKQPNYANLLATGFKPQDRGGIFVSFATLGFSSGQTVYGYSLMANDVTVTNPSQIINYTNVTNYPLTTNDANGGLDLIGDVDIFRLNNLSCILPVTFSDIKAVNTSMGISIQWQTLMEKDNARFEVEHSADGLNFEKIGVVNSKKDFSSVADYSFLHRKPESGINYYRVKQVDMDGRYEYSKVAQATVKAEPEKGISVFPNPVHADELNSLFIKVKTPGEYDFCIYNATGQKVWSVVTSTSDGLIKYSGNTKFISGYYTIRISSLKTKDTFTSRLFVQ